MEMSDSLVYDVERFSSRLFGACMEWPRCSADLKDRQCNELGGGRRRLDSGATGVGRSGSHKEQQTHSGDGI